MKQRLGRRRRWTIAAIAAVYAVLGLLLSGCLDYSAGVRFRQANGGAIVQEVRLGDRLAALGDSAATVWLESLARRAERLGGRTRSPSPQELQVEIPFANGAELVERFNAFFGPPEPGSGSAPAPGSLPPAVDALRFDARLDLQQNNWLVAVRNRLTYRADLRSLGTIATDDALLVGPGSLLSLSFALDAPWGFRAIAAEGTDPPEWRDGRWVWVLAPGRFNRLEATFWVPSYLGLGALAIAGLTVLGWIGRDRFLAGDRGAAGISGEGLEPVDRPG